MAKETEGHAEGMGKKKKHLHQIRTVAAGDGTFVHHHTYKSHKDDPHTEPEREHAATSMNEEEAGQHVAEQMGMNGGGAAGGEGGGEEPGAGGEQPGAGGDAAMPGQ